MAARTAARAFSETEISLQRLETQSPRDSSAHSETLAQIPSSSSREFRQVEFVRSSRLSHVMLAGSFRLSERDTLESPGHLPQSIWADPDASSIQKEGYVGKLLCILRACGWLRDSGLIACMIVVSLAIEALILGTTIYRALPMSHSSEQSLSFQQDFDLMTTIHAITRHGSTVLSHIGMIWGGIALSRALQSHDYTLPILHVVILAVFTGGKYCSDLTLLYSRFNQSSAIGFSRFFPLLRRAFIMFQRLPCSVATMVMMAIPKRLCQDLVRVVLAIEEGEIGEASRLYSVFWSNMKTARIWYSLVMTPQFLVAVISIPILMEWYRHNYSKGDAPPRSGTADKWVEQWCHVVYAVLDILQLLVWVKPAINIRRNHAVALGAVMEVAGQGSDEARDLATMIATLHPHVGLRFMTFSDGMMQGGGSVVTWRLLGLVSTLAGILLSLLQYIVEFQAA